MATKPLRPAPPPPVPKHNTPPQAQGPLRRDNNNNNRNERKNEMAPCRPTVIRPKMVQTPKKKPPPRPPPPRPGRPVSKKGPLQNAYGSVSDSTMADIEAAFGPPKMESSNGTASGLLSRRTGFIRGQLNLFGSTGKGRTNAPRKGPAPKQPTSQRSSFRKGAAPAPPVPPHLLASVPPADLGPSLISFDSPPASPTTSVASGSSGASSGASWQGAGAPVSLLDLDIPPMQPPMWNGSAGLPHSQTAHWGPREGPAGDAADDAWNFPRNYSLPSLAQCSASAPDPWSFPDMQHTGDDMSGDSPTEDWSPPPPCHPPPAPPLEENCTLTDPSGVAVAKMDHQASTPGELSFRVHDLIALLSEEGPEQYRARCGNEEGLVPKRCLDILTWPRQAQNSTTEVTSAVTSRRVLYDFEAESPQELSLGQGDVVHLLGTLDKDWALGELHGKRGRFPLAFLEPEQSQSAAGCPAIALYSFTAEQDGDLGFSEGDTVIVLSRINKDWLYGERKGHKGQFPASFVQPISKQAAAKGTNVEIYKAAFAFEAQHADELTLRPGDKVEVTQKVNSDWWQGRLLGSAMSSSEGIFPAKFVESLS